jgi:hypothetical protein
VIYRRKEGAGRKAFCPAFESQVNREMQNWFCAFEWIDSPTHEMRQTLEVAPTSIHSSSQKGMRTHRPSLSRSRRDTPSKGRTSRIDRRPANGRLRRI